VDNLAGTGVLSTAAGPCAIHRRGGLSTGEPGFALVLRPPGYGARASPDPQSVPRSCSTRRAGPGPAPASPQLDEAGEAGSGVLRIGHRSCPFPGHRGAPCHRAIIPRLRLQQRELWPGSPATRYDNGACPRIGRFLDSHGVWRDCVFGAGEDRYGGWRRRTGCRARARVRCRNVAGAATLGPGMPGLSALGARHGRHSVNIVCEVIEGAGPHQPPGNRNRDGKAERPDS